LNDRLVDELDDLGAQALIGALLLGARRRVLVQRPARASFVLHACAAARRSGDPIERLEHLRLELGFHRRQRQVLLVESSSSVLAVLVFALGLGPLVFQAGFADACGAMGPRGLVAVLRLGFLVLVDIQPRRFVRRRSPLAFRRRRRSLRDR
jgi:hypothetical protein